MLVILGKIDTKRNINLTESIACAFGWIWRARTNVKFEGKGNGRGRL